MTICYRTERLPRAIAERGPLCVGIDPAPGLLRAWGLPRTRRPGTLRADGMVEASARRCRSSSRSRPSSRRTGRPASRCSSGRWPTSRAAGALSLLDVKRGDIGSTMDAYAAAYLTDGSPLAADAITLSPYLGFGSLAGAIELAPSARAAASTCSP